eukprot:8724164-Ditylum_brightwellii.AAC.1
MKVKKDGTKAADFCAVVAVTKRDIESGKHRQYKLDANKFICETRDGMDVISTVVEDKESSGCKSSSASPSSTGPSSSCMSSNVSTASSSLC